MFPSLSSPPSICLSFYAVHTPSAPPSSRYAVNVDGKEGKEWEEGKDWKDNGKGKELEPSRPVSVMSSLSYRKRSNMKDSIGGKGDESSLLNTLKEQSDSQDLSSFRKNKAKQEAEDDSYSVSSWRKAGDDLDDRGSVISQAYSEAASRARKGMDSRWSDFDKESVVSPSRASTCRTAMDLDDDAISSVSRMSSVSRRRSMPRLDDRQSEYGSAVSPSLSRRSPGGMSRADSRMSLSRSCRLSEFDVDDDARSIAFSEARSSAYSPHSTSGRSFSMPPQARNTDSSPPDVSDVKPVGHRNYLDPDLEAAINEVLSFKPIKFKRTSLDDSEAEKDKPGEVEDGKKSVNSSRTGRDSGRSSSVRRSASAVDFMRSSSSLSTRSSHSKKGKSKKKKKKSHSSESDSSDSSDDSRKKKSSKKKGKKSKKKSKKESSSSSSSSESESSTESDSSSGASTISYRSSSSIKKAPGRQASGSEGELEPEGPSEGAPPRSKKEEKKRKKKVDNLMMKYLYRPDSD